jgi:arsenite methyltransferase
MRWRATGRTVDVMTNAAGTAGTSSTSDTGVHSGTHTSSSVSPGACPINLDVVRLRRAVQDEYAEVATDPARGFHFHTGRPLASMLGYDPADVDPLPDVAVESFAGVGSPWWWGRLRPGEFVAEIGSGAGLDAIIAARQVAPAGRVIGVDMTPAMLEKARANAALIGVTNEEFREGPAEDLPVPDAFADVITSNGVINLCPDKDAVYRELFRALKPGGRLQIADIIVSRAVPRDAREDTRCWSRRPRATISALPSARSDGRWQHAGEQTTSRHDNSMSTIR